MGGNAMKHHRSHAFDPNSKLINQKHRQRVRDAKEGKMPRAEEETDPLAQAVVIIGFIIVIFGLLGLAGWLG
jgi:hypothetical protein